MVGGITSRMDWLGDGVSEFNVAGLWKQWIVQAIARQLGCEGTISRHGEKIYGVRCKQYVKEV